MASLHPKNVVLKQRLLDAPHWLCMERARYYTEAYRETEGQPPALRAAAGLRRTFEHMTIRIEPEELLVGNRSSRPIAPPIAPERGDFTFIFEHLFKELEDFGYRISDSDRRLLFEEILPYWKGKTVRDQKVAALRRSGLSSTLNLSPKEIGPRLRAFGSAALRRLFVESKDAPSPAAVGGFLLDLPRLVGAVRGGSADNVKGRCRCTDVQAHIVIGYKNVLKHGFQGIREQALGRLDLGAPADQRPFLQAVVEICEATRDFSERFAELADRLASNSSPERARELERIAANCRRVPWLPPRDFHEALQAMWFTQNAAIISYGAGSGITPGRVDQLLSPFFEKSLKEGSMTSEEALRLVEELVIKLNDNVIIWPNIGGVRLNHLGSDVQNITIGGVGRDGEDLTNDLSYVFIEAIENTNLATTASFRVSRHTPPEFIEKVVAVHRHTNSPAFLNDDVVVPALTGYGCSLEDSRDYCLVGCVEPSGNGDTYGATGGSKIYFPTALDLVFNRGRTSFFRNQETIDTGDPRKMQSFREFLDAFYQQVEQMVVFVTRATNLRDAVWASSFHNPLISSTIDGCIETGRDMTEGGARYNFGSVGGGGLGTVVDSLAAIRKFVFEERSVSMDELMLALSTNYERYEKLRAKLKEGPKFGNDDDYVDEIAAELLDRFCAMVSAKRTSTGGRYKPSLISYGLNVYEGALEPATPDGRGAGEPISNSISPSNGAERRGPTAALNSLAKLDHTKVGYGDSLNMRFPVGILESEKGVKSVSHLVATYFEKGGFHVQFNTADSATLRDAQEHPERHADLIVRVSGYSAYFTRLGKSIQDDIIERVEFDRVA